MDGVGAPALLLPAGATPHSYSLRPSDARKLARTDLVIRVGQALETFLTKPLANIATRARVITLMRTGRDDHSTDPHIWLDPNQARRIVRQVTVAIRRLDPENAGIYDSNARKTLARIVRLDTAIAADLETVKSLYLPHDGIDDLRSVARVPNLEELSVWNNNITDLTPLAGLKNLKQIIIYDNPELTRTEIGKLKAALPNCVIRHNAKKL